MMLIMSYILALLLNEGHLSLVKASGILAFISHDMLTRILLRGGFNPYTDVNFLPAGGYIAIDDTVIRKPHSKYIEGVSYTYSSSDEKVMKGLCFVLIIWVVGRQVFVLDVIPWKKGGKKKNALVREALTRFYLAGLKPTCVLFDAWYAASKTLNLLNGFGWIYMARIKNNRIFNSKAIKTHRYFGAKGLSGKLNGVYHTVQITKHCNRYLVTNNLRPLTSTEARNIYRKRWIIEEVFRDLKDNLHLEKCSSRTLKAQKHHMEACLQAYLFLRKNYPGKSVQSAHQEFLKEHRYTKTPPKLIQLLAA